MEEADQVARMNRRKFLQGLLATSAAVAIAPVILAEQRQTITISGSANGYYDGEYHIGPHSDYIQISNLTSERVRSAKWTDLQIGRQGIFSG